MSKLYLIIANIEWNYLKQRHQFIAEGLVGAGDEVVFLESSAKRNPTLADIPRIIDRIVRVVTKKDVQASGATTSLSVITPLVLPSTNHFFDFLNKAFFLRKVVAKICAQKGRKPDYIINYLPTVFALDVWASLGKPPMIYECASNFDAVPGMPKKRTPRIEKIVTRESVHITVDSDFLLDKFRDSGKTTQIGPGVNVAQFQELAQSPANPAIESILYFGAVDEKTDTDMINALAERGYRMTIIGSIKPGTTISPKVAVLPPVAHAALPAAIRPYDALLLPYNNSAYAQGVIPAKFYECFATGKPIIASESENFRQHAALIIMGNIESLPGKITAYTAEADQKARRQRLAIAAQNGWDGKVRTLKALFENAGGKTS